MAIALALKYRPTQFSDLIGQESVSQTLSLALDHGRISHAYLFSGLRGSGKTSSARIFARALQCEKGPTSTPCGECDNCKSALENRHLDIIEMDAASSRKIDDIRDLIEQTKYRPSYGRYKIFIIDEVHMLTKEAFNALLKTLEEPPEYVKFILATTDPLKLPATILSRTQHFRFKKIPHKAVLTHIAHILDIEGVSYEPQSLEIIARSGSGSLRDTLTITDQAINFCNKHITTLKVTEMLGVVDPHILEEFFGAILDHDKTKIQDILVLLEEYECEMIIDEMMMFLKQALHSKNKNFPIIIIDRFLRILNESKYLLNLNSDGDFVLLLLSLKMEEAMKVKDIDSMIEELESHLSQNRVSKSFQHQAEVKPTHDSSTQEISMQPSSILPTKNLFEVLIAKIYDRNKTLGEIFEKNVAFVSFADSILKWKSSAIGEDKAMLLQNFPYIKLMVQEIYGVSTKISPSQSQQENPSPQLNSLPTPRATTQDSIKSETISPIQTQPTPQPLSSRSSHEIFKEENKELIESIKINLGATQMIVIDNKDQQ
ncbi:DNA polymerase III subunit gamma/tau [Helicobacter sp. 11S03491-1]|uniref:DNA polymerase III subunit gamma/tau n=1 Tax=Helicobacter sp. 11S03491-1 TaxID=1476196 RepID=UPI000BA5E0CE|nr:DNA polymerase III subunit gamma/tau [Helicobacter sp. 11S03491-1]PAF43403.1 DNA polymerase III subunit gamma/tau [Helicobacter sp. 11S03491-1]